MRKKLTRLLLLFVGLLVGLSAMAQKDVTKQYITNATLSSLDGWTNVNFNTPVNGYNSEKHSNATTGYASECYEGWSSVEKSEFSLTQTITLPAGHYTLVNYSFFREGANYNTDASTSRAYLKAGNNQVPVKTLGSITAQSYADSQWEAADCFDSKMYRNTLDFTISSDNTQIEIGVYGTFNTSITKSWMILGQFELIAKDIPATVDAPFDVTGYIMNPGFEYRDLTGWTMSPEGSFDIQNNNQAFKAGWYYAEKWQSSGALSARSFSQTVNNLPAGLYKLTANLGGDGTYIKLNDRTANWSGDKDYTVNYVLETPGSLTITAGKTAEGTANWIHFDNFKLYFCGDVVETLNALRGQVEQLSEEPMNGAVKTALTNTYNNTASPADYLEAIDQITEAIDNAKASIANYEKALEVLNAANSLDAAGQAAYAADEDVSTLQTAYDNGTLEAVTPVQKAACEDALIPAVKAQTTAGSDMTLAISNWDFLNCQKNNFPGWAISNPKNGNAQNLGNTSVEYWIETAANGEFDYYQTVTDLPVGKYTLTASMWNSANNEAGASVNGSAGVYGTSGANTVFAGVTAESDNNSLRAYTTDELIVADGTLRLGVKNNGTMGARWFGVDWIKLTFTGGELTPEEISALKATIPEGAMNADVATNLTTAANNLDGNATWANYGALAQAIAAAKASIKAYENAAQWLPVNKAELEGTNFYNADAYQYLISNVEKGLKDGSMSDIQANALTDIRTEWRAANYIDDILMSSWDEDVEKWDSYHVNTWSEEGDKDGSNFKVPFIEYWTADANSLGEKTLSGTIEGLEPGNYAVTAWVRVRTKNGVTSKPYGIVMSVNDGEGVAIEGEKLGNSQMYLQKVAALGTVNGDGKLTLKFDVSADNNVSWLSFKNVNYVKGAATIADFKETEGPALLNLTGAEAFLEKDGITYVQDATAGLAIKSYTINGFNDNNQILSGQLYGIASGDTIIVDAGFNGNSIAVSEGKATPKELTAAEAAQAANTFQLAKLLLAQISEENEVKYANNENGKVEIDNRLCEDLVVNAGDVVNTLTGVTFLAEGGEYSVIAPREQDDVVPLLWEATNGVEIGDEITEENLIDLTTDDVKARMANLKAGDVLNLVIETTANANILVANENGNIFTIPVSEEVTNVEIPITEFIETVTKRHGLKICSDNTNLKAKYITVRNAKYDRTDFSIWLGEGNIAILGQQHFASVHTGDHMIINDYDEGTLQAGEVNITPDEAFSEEQVDALLDGTLTWTGEITYIGYAHSGDEPDNLSNFNEGISFTQGELYQDVNGMIMTFGGNDPEGKTYEFIEAYPSVNKNNTVTEGIDQFPVDNEGNSYDAEKENLPTKGTYYVFEPTKNGKLEMTIGVEKGKDVILTEDGKEYQTKKFDEDFNGAFGPFQVEATKTYYLFANDTNLKLYGFTFTPDDANARNTARDIAHFKLLPFSQEGDTLLLKDAVVTYIHGDDVFVEDASGAIDFFRTKIQYYVGQKLNGYIVGQNDKENFMPVLRGVDGTKYGQFKVTDNVTAEATPATITDVIDAENVARFMSLEFVELSTNEKGMRILTNTETGETVLLEDAFSTFFSTGDLFEKIDGIVAINKEGESAFWPTSKEGTVVSDGYKRMVETELDVTNKDEAKTKDNAVKGISVTLESASNAGSGSAQAGAMTSKGYKLRTANGSPVKASARFLVNEGQKVFDMTINAIANYAAKDAEKACITVTKVEVDGQEVSFEGGLFPQKGSGESGSLILKGINAEKDIVLYFDNSNAEGTQLNMSYEIVCRGEKIYTQKEKDLIAEAKKLAEDREAVAVGLLDDAIEVAEAGNTNGLQAAVDKFKADNADLEKDETAKVGTAVDKWNVNSGNNSNRGTYSKNGITLIEHYGDSQKAVMISQEVSVDNGPYNIEVYATSYNERGEDGASLQETSGAVAYVFGTSGDNTVKTWIAARKGEGKGLLDDDPKTYSIKGVQVENGKLTIGLALDKEKQTGWHTIQIKSLKWATTAKAAYASEKNKLTNLLEEAEELLAGDQIGGKAKLQAATDAANEAKESIRLNIEDMANEVAKLQAAIDKFHAAGKVFVQHVATGKYLAGGANWGTRAILNDVGLDFAITSDAEGKMIFDSGVSNSSTSHFLRGGDDVYVDGPSTAWTVEQLPNGNYTISDGSRYLTALENIDNFNGYIIMPGETADEWRFITVEERTEALEAATSSAPIDATFLVKDANFSRNDQRVSNWNVSSDCTNKNLAGGANENMCAESFHSTFTISQVIQDLPAGTYTLKLQGFYRQDDNANEAAPSFFANDEMALFGPLTGTENSMTDASNTFSTGGYQMDAITVTIAEGETLTVGIKGVGTHQWVIWDNFQLTYYGVEGAPVTAISEVKAETAEPAARNSFEDGAVYNLRGQKVEGTLKPGLYIKNGKKFVVK